MTIVMTSGPLIFPKGMTVKELKEAIKYWPETDTNGDPSEVWMEIDLGVSSQVSSIWNLNQTDMLISTDKGTI